MLKKGFNREQITRDVTVGIVALPLAIAFGIASGVSPEKGLITAIIAGFLISLLGGSRVQIGGPTGAFIVIVYGIVEQYGVEDELRQELDRNNIATVIDPRMIFKDFNDALENARSLAGHGVGRS